MTISSQTRKAGPFVGNDSTTAFPFAFKVFTAADMYVVKTDTDLEVETVLVLNTDYTVSLNADQNANPGGTITLPTALATGFTLTVTSNISPLQQTDLTNQGGFYPAIITNALDKLTILIQQALDSIGRSLKLPVSTPSGVSTTLPLPSSNKLIGWNQDADGLQNVDPTTLATIVAFGTANADVFDGDGVTTQFNLTANPGALNNLDVSIGGVTQTPGLDYTWTSGTVITFTSAPPVGTDNVLVRYMQGLPQGTTDAALVAARNGGADFGDVQGFIDLSRKSISEFTHPWGKSPDSQLGDAIYRATSATSDPVISISTDYNATGPLAPDFPGAQGGSAPVGLYIQHRQTGTTPTNNAFTHSIMGYALNGAAGDNDVIGVSGRARKLNVTNGIGDAAGIWGSAYQESTQNGGVMGGEVHIYQNVAGQGAQDQLNAKWSVGFHVFSASTGSPAHSGVNIDGLGETPGFYGYWNALVIERNCFHGAGVPGTVGINCGSWNTSYNPQYGIKFGEAGRHIFASGDLRISTGEGSKVQVVHKQDAGGAIFQVLSTTGYNSAIDLVNNNGIKGQLFYDSVQNNVKLGTFGALDLQFRTNETYRGSFNQHGDFLINQASFDSGYGFGFTNTGYTAWYRNTSTATDGVLDLYSNVGGTKVNVFRLKSDGSFFMPAIPTSSAGLPSGSVYRNGNTLMIV